MNALYVTPPTGEGFDHVDAATYERILTHGAALAYERLADEAASILVSGVTRTTVSTDYIKARAAFERDHLASLGALVPLSPEEEAILQQLRTTRLTAIDKGYDAAHDDEHHLGHLLHEATRRLYKAATSHTHNRRERLLETAGILIAAIAHHDRHNNEPERTDTNA